MLKDSAGANQNVSLLNTANVSFQIGDRDLLQNISLSLRPGEIVGLIGPNGAGKSTLLRLLSGLWKATSGEVLLCGKPIARYSTRQIAQLIGQVQQSAALDAPFSVQEIVAMGRNPHVGRFEIEKPQDKAAVVQAMNATNTLSLADRSVNRLSGGERQRVFLARALAQEPSILLLDEPTSNLDVRHQIEILALVQQQAHVHGLGVLIAIHDLSMAARFCERLILLHGGYIMAEGTPESVLTVENLANAFGVDAQPYRDPYTHDLKLSIALPSAS
jgi:iron complex transport system ATP-binding protein